MKVTEFENKVGIKHFPIKLEYDGSRIKTIVGQKQGYNDFKIISDKELVNRNRRPTTYNVVAGDTTMIHRIDVDDSDAFRKAIPAEIQAKLRDTPHYLSRNKRYPHYYIKLDNCDDERPLCKHNSFDLLKGQWAFYHRNETMINSDKEIVVIDFNLIKHLFKESGKPKAKLPKPSAKTTSSVLKFDPDYTEMGKKQIAVLQKVLMEVPEEYAMDYVKWRNVGFALSSYCNTKKCFQLWLLFSKRCEAKYNYDHCVTVWNDSDGSFTIGSIIHIHKSLPNVPEVNYNVLSRSHHINLFNIEHVKQIPNMSVESCDLEYITDTDGHVQLDIEGMQCVLVKSHTGSGKTTAMKTLHQRAKASGQKTISIVSRRTLAEKHANDLKIDNYEYVHGVLSDSTVCQLESINRISLDDDEPYVLFLDEINSLVSHIKSPTVKNRTNVLITLKMFINRASFVFGIDADMSDDCVSFFRCMLDDSKHINLFCNGHDKKATCDVLVHGSMSTMIQKIKADIQNNVPIFVGSDSLTKFKEQVVGPVKLLLGDDESKVKLYSSEDGNKSDFSNSDVVITHCPFTSPTIVYGVDITTESSVYGFYFGNSMNALGCYQQLSRVRTPKSIDIYFDKDYTLPKYQSPDAIKSELEDGCKYLEQMVEINYYKAVNDPTLFDAYFTYVCQSEYIDDQFKNLRYHVCDILHHKGYKIVINANAKGKADKVKESYTAKEDMTLLESIMNQLDDQTKMQSYMKRMEIIGIDMSTEIEDEKVENYVGSLITDNKQFREFLTMRQYLFRSLQNLEYSVKNSQDLPVHLTKAKVVQLMLIKKLERALSVKSAFACDVVRDYDKLTKSKTKIQLDKTLIQAFNLRGDTSMFDKPIPRVDAYKFLLECISKLVPSMTQCKKKRFEGKEQRFKTIDHKKLSQHLSVYQYTAIQKEPIDTFRKLLE